MSSTSHLLVRASQIERLDEMIVTQTSLGCELSEHQNKQVELGPSELVTGLTVS